MSSALTISIPWIFLLYDVRWKDLNPGSLPKVQRLVVQKHSTNLGKNEWTASSSTGTVRHTAWIPMADSIPQMHSVASELALGLNTDISANIHVPAL